MTDGDNSSMGLWRSLQKRAKHRWLRWLLPPHRWSAMQFFQAVGDRPYVQEQSAVVKDGYILVFVKIPPSRSSPFERWCEDVGAVIEKRDQSPNARVTFELGGKDA